MTQFDDRTANLDASANFWGEEENFWLEGPDYYRAHMVPDAVMDFPEPTGILKGPQVLAALENAPRWESVVFFDKDIESLGNKVRLTYRAEAWKNGARAYEATCESTYVKTGGDWLLTAHKQVPIDR